MPPRPTSSEHRVHPALVVTGITIGILFLFFVQFAIPYLIGPIGLVVVAFLDLSIYLWLRHRRIARKRPRKYSHVIWGPVDRRYAVKRHDALQKEIAATFVFGAFLLGLYMLGVALRVESLWLSTNIDLYLLGSIMTAIALRFSMGYRYAWIVPESEKFDTTEDH